MNREHDTIEEGHPACQGEEFLELPLLLSSRHLAALKTVLGQGVTVGRLQNASEKMRLQKIIWRPPGTDI